MCMCCCISFTWPGCCRHAALAVACLYLDLKSLPENNNIPKCITGSVQEHKWQKKNGYTALRQGTQKVLPPRWLEATGSIPIGVIDRATTTIHKKAVRKAFARMFEILEFCGTHTTQRLPSILKHTANETDL